MNVLLMNALLTNVPLMDVLLADALLIDVLLVEAVAEIVTDVPRVVGVIAAACSLELKGLDTGRS